jgi:hypothetical protein
MIDPGQRPPLQWLAQHDDHYPKDDNRGSANQQLLRLAIKHARARLLEAGAVTILSIEHF